MSWTPPVLKSQRLDLISLSDKPPINIQNHTLEGLVLFGLPSNWSIFLKDSDEPMGSIGFIRWDRECGLGEIGFILKHSERRRGYMREACAEVFDFGFNVMELEVIEGRVMPNNHASTALLEKIGMKKGERVQARLSQKGVLVDLDIYRMSKPEQ